MDIPKISEKEKATILNHISDPLFVRLARILSDAEDTGSTYFEEKLATVTHQRNRAAEAISLILPLAKGYAANKNVLSSHGYIDIARAIMDEIDEENNG